MKSDNILKFSIFFFALAVVVGIYTFFVIPDIKKEQEKNIKDKFNKNMTTYVSVLTYKGKTPLLEDTIITDAISDCFESTLIPINDTTSNCISNFEDIRGLQLKYTLVEGQYVMYQNFEKYLKETNGDERLKEFDICSTVAGQAIPGRYVDILIRYPDGSVDVVVPKIQIYDMVNCENDNLYKMVFAVNEKEHNALVNALKEGVLDIRVYLNDDQEASVQTYTPSFVRKVNDHGIS